MSTSTSAMDRTEGRAEARDLQDLRPLIVFIDGVAGRDTPRPDLLCAWALTWEGRRVLLALEPGLKDAPDHAWMFLADLKRRGLADPLVVVTDGESALLRASELCFPSALVQRCLVHHLRALGHRLPPGAGGHVLHAVRAACEAPSVNAAETLRRDVSRRHGASLPSLIFHFERTFDACTTHLGLPRSLQRLARATFVPECLLAAESRLAKDASRPDASFDALRSALAAVIGESPAVVVTEDDRRHLAGLSAHLARRAG